MSRYSNAVGYHNKIRFRLHLDIIRLHLDLDIIRLDRLLRIITQNHPLCIIKLERPLCVVRIRCLVRSILRNTHARHATLPRLRAWSRELTREYLPGTACAPKPHDAGSSTACAAIKARTQWKVFVCRTHRTTATTHAAHAKHAESQSAASVHAISTRRHARVERAAAAGWCAERGPYHAFHADVLVFRALGDVCVGCEGTGAVACEGGHDAVFLFVRVDGARGLEVFGKGRIGVDSGTCKSLARDS
jgi:hypothetical protein